MTQSTAETMFWLASVLCLVAELAILRAAFNPSSDTSVPASIPHPSRGAEMLWAVIPAVALAVLLAATWRAIH